MIHKAKDLSPDQKVVVEGLLGRPVSEDEAISVRAITPAAEWLRKSWGSAARQGLDRLSAEEIDAEIAAARKSRRSRQQE